MKRAVLFGLNYATDPKNVLNGCINDVNDISNLLTKDGYICDVYTDSTDSEHTTSTGIKQHIATLTRVSKAGDICLIYFSGHGVQVTDYNGDEADGKDEALYTSNNTVVLDDELHSLFSQFVRGVHVLFISDSCHSGSQLDLKYQWKLRYTKNKPTHFKRQMYHDREPLKAHVIALSGCRDKQTSMDAYGVFGRTGSGGVLTSALLCIFNQLSLHCSIQSVILSLKKLLNASQHPQQPVLCTSFRTLNTRTSFIS